MIDILIRAGVFVSIIGLGFLLRRIGLFREEDFHTLSKLVIRIVLPAAIVTSFAGKTFDLSLLSLVLLGLGAQLLLLLAGFLISLKGTNEEKAFSVLNMQGFNIGTFTLPFVQSFMGPMGVIASSLFDTGNAFITLGGAYSIAAMIKDGNKFDGKRFVKALLKSVPFMTYLIMVILSAARITLPAPLLSFAETVAGANAFLAMFMIGVGFRLKLEKSQLGKIARIIVPRYCVAAVLALVFYFLLPYDLEIRKTLAILVFAPISAAVPPYTAELKGDIGLSSAINSIAILISIVSIVTLLTIMG